jgi:hypothetical protein
MSPFILEQAFDQLTGVDVPGPATRFIEAKQEQHLAAEVEELAALRFGIVLTARWESDPDEEPQHRKELRAELATLRARYFDRIDHVAMDFGVAIAMKLKDEVERRVALPLRARLADLPRGAGETDNV